MGGAERDLTDQVTLEDSATSKVGPYAELLTSSEGQTIGAGALQQTNLPQAPRSMLKANEKASIEHRERKRGSGNTSEDPGSGRLSIREISRGVGRGKAAIFALRPLSTPCVAGPIGPKRPREQGCQHTMGSHRHQYLKMRWPPCDRGKTPMGRRHMAYDRQVIIRT